jgi:uncharacterized membrane protein
MNLSETGEARINGYLFLLDKSLRTFLRREVAADAVREVESHIRERVAETEAMPNERDALNRLLDALGPPHRLARAYSTELAVDEAVTTGQLVATARAILALTFHTTEGFFVGLALLCGYVLSAGFLLVAILKPIFPDNVGVFTVNGELRGSGFEPNLPPGTVVSHGWWLALISVITGSILLWLTHRGTKAYLARVRHRRQLAREGLA